jgi:hypothetical protein
MGDGSRTARSFEENDALRAEAGARVGELVPAQVIVHDTERQLLFPSSNAIHPQARPSVAVVRAIIAGEEIVQGARSNPYRLSTRIIEQQSKTLEHPTLDAALEKRAVGKPTKTESRRAAAIHRPFDSHHPASISGLRRVSFATRVRKPSRDFGTDCLRAVHGPETNPTLLRRSPDPPPRARGAYTRKRTRVRLLASPISEIARSTRAYPERRDAAASRHRAVEPTCRPRTLGCLIVVALAMDDDIAVR